MRIFYLRTSILTISFSCLGLTFNNYGMKMEPFTEYCDYNPSNEAIDRMISASQDPNGADIVLECITKNGVNPNLEAGIIALINASSRGYLKTVDILINYGADPNEALYRTASLNDIGSVKIFLRCNVNASAVLIKAVNSGKINSVRTLLQCGVNPNIPDYNNNTALNRAVIPARTEIAKLLIEYGATVDQKLIDSYLRMKRCIIQQCSEGIDHLNERYAEEIKAYSFIISNMLNNQEIDIGKFFHESLIGLFYCILDESCIEIINNYNQELKHGNEVLLKEYREKIENMYKQKLAEQQQQLHAHTIHSSQNDALEAILKEAYAKQHNAPYQESPNKSGWQ